MKTIEEIVKELTDYDGKPLVFMEVCGSHTAAIAKYGIRGLLSSKIRLISGPGCPVCVTPSAYVDRLIEIAKEENTSVVTFGDLLRVPGSKQCLREAQAEGAQVEMVYSPMDTLKLAAEHPERNYVFAAIGFETTAPVFTLLLEEVEKRQLNNVRILTSIKTMPPVIDWLMEQGASLDGFIAPGHVCAITGSELFQPLAKKHGIPFAVSGFSDQELILAIYGLVQMASQGEVTVKNYYPSIVEEEGNVIAKEKLQKYFEPCDAVWRGMGSIPGSGLQLRKEYEKYDAGSSDLVEDRKRNAGCRCGDILMGRMESKDCPLFGKVCTPQNPQGACMVSYEGSCYQQFINQ